ncbi:MAG: FAD-binding oxidoreductase [bacterium]
MFEYKYRIKSISQPANDLVLIDLVSANGQPIFKYRPGQYVMISYRNEAGQIEEKHSFSIASSPTEQGVLRLGIRVMGRFTQGLLKLKPESDILVYGPFGTFSFDEARHASAVFLAGGIGITPFLSALAYATDKKLPNQLSLLYSNRTLKGTAFFDDLKKIESTNSNVKMLMSVTDEKSLAPTAGIITERFCTSILKDFIGDVYAKTFFLCGPAAFMKGMKNCLLELGAKEEQILMEEFSMTANRSAFSRLNYVVSMAGYGALAALLPFYVIYAANTKAENQTPMQTPTLDVAGNIEEPETMIDKAIEYLPNALDKDENVTKNAVTGVNGTETEAQAVVSPTVYNTLKKISNTPAVIKAAVIKAATPNVAAPKTASYKTPVPKTTSSIPANEATANSNTQPTTAPKPTTASSITTHTTTPGQANQTPANTTPTPSTSASGATTAGPSTNGGSTATNPSTPTPITNASGTVISGGSTATTGTGAVNTGRNREEEDD